MARQRVLLLADSQTLADVLCELFGDEDLDVTVCQSLAEVQAAVRQFPLAVVVSDSWANGESQTLSPAHRAEIVALGKTAQVVLTTDRNWAKASLEDGELGTVRVVLKPYALGTLMAAVRAALAAG